MAGTSERRQDFAAASHHSSNESAHNDHQNPRRCDRNLGHHRRAVLHHKDYDAKSSRGEVGFFRRQQHRRLGSWNRRYWFLGTYPGGGPPRADASVSNSVFLLEPKLVESPAEAEAREGASMTKNDFAFRIDRWTDNGERRARGWRRGFPDRDGDLPCCPQALAQRGNDLAAGHVGD